MNTPSIPFLKRSFEKFQRTNKAAVAISERNIGQIHTGRQRRALIVFTKLIAHNMSIEKLIQDFLETPTAEKLVDHFSIATLARASIDAALVTMYISEPSLTLTQWDFRRQWLFLHDANNRSRFLRPLDKEGVKFPFFETSDEIRQGIISKIKILGAQLLLTTEALEKMFSYPPLFVNGPNGAVKEAGWDLNTYKFAQSYLSAYVHTHPVSFMRAYEHDLKFGGISQFQADFLSFIFSLIEETTKSAVSRMETFSDPVSGDPNGHLE